HRRRRPERIVSCEAPFSVDVFDVSVSIPEVRTRHHISVTSNRRRVLQNSSFERPGASQHHPCSSFANAVLHAWGLPAKSDHSTYHTRIPGTLDSLTWHSGSGRRPKSSRAD